MTQEALKLVLPLLEDCVNSYGLKYERPAFVKAITAIKEALAQPEQEPVAWMNEEMDYIFFDTERPEPFAFDFWKPLYTTPPQRTWLGLTDEDIDELWESIPSYYNNHDFAQAIEAKLKQKNGFAEEKNS